jgi:hypothetical protein
MALSRSIPRSGTGRPWSGRCLRSTLYDRIGTREHDGGMPVCVPDHERRSAVSAAYLDNLHRMVGVADRAPVHTESIPHSCLHDPPPFAAPISVLRLSAGGKGYTDGDHASAYSTSRSGSGSLSHGRCHLIASYARRKSTAVRGASRSPAVSEQTAHRLSNRSAALVAVKLDDSSHDEQYGENQPPQ